MAPKKQTPPPIDRPLSKAYLRQFSGWSDQYPPGQSEPTSLRVMENVMVDRNGAVGVRPGLRHLSFTTSPDLSPTEAGVPGSAAPEQALGSMEPFYLNDGTRAYLYAVREYDGRVGFRALRVMDSTRTVATLPECGFTNYSTVEHPFSSGTSYVHYVQIDNTIIALSDNGEPARHFHAGVAKRVSVPQEVLSPTWSIEDKPKVVHPDADWINATTVSVRTNLLPDPSMRLGSEYWRPGDRTEVVSGPDGGLTIRSLPARTNLVNSPLHDVGSTGAQGWFPELNAAVGTSAGMLQVSAVEPGAAFARSSTMARGIEERRWYHFAMDLGPSDMEALRISITFLSCGSVPIGSPLTFELPAVTGRSRDYPVLAPEGAVAAVLYVGGRADSAGQSMRIANVVLCRIEEPTSMFIPGSGDWTGVANASPSVVHPPVDAVVLSSRVSVPQLKPVSTGISVKGSGTAVSLGIRMYSGADAPLGGTTETTATTTASWQTVVNTASNGLSTIQQFLRVRLTAKALARGQEVQLGGAVLEQAAAAGAYFDGSTPWADSTVVHRWEGQPHRSPSTRTQYDAPKPPLTAETPAATTLISSDATKNTAKIGIYYTFENEVGESAPSQITETRMMRPWSDWLWKKPGADGQPTGAATDDPDQCADQLVVQVPRQAYDTAVAQGARRLVVYGFAWTDQDPVPVSAERIAVRELYPDPLDDSTQSHYYENGGWIAITPQRWVGSELVPLPSRESRENYSYPLRHKAGVAAADRLVMVGDPTDPATIAWSSNTAGRYSIFSPWSGGGQKTLSSGNLHLPHAVVLWQNPQSVDTLTVLCTSDTERSITYYMNPFTTNTSNGSTYGMGFEETTNTPGSESPYAVEVLNNALYRPVDTSLLKSTASNYNISHKVMTEQVARSWAALLGKYRMVSAQLDNRLYYLVHNSKGEPLREGCIGNEVWVLDIAAEQGHWSRFIVHASGLRVLDLGGSAYVGVVGPHGLSYLDPDYRWDDVVDTDGIVRRKPIPWRLETNLQGANRAHDAWAHVQQMAVTLGSFEGSVRWGLRGYTLHGQWLDLSKTTVAQVPVDRGQQWAQDDQLLVRRDMKEWYFHAQSVPDVHGWGSVQLVQYRYTPTTVNVGYEFGSVETFEYGTPAPGTYAGNGVPQPFADAGRTWM